MQYSFFACSYENIFLKIVDPENNELLGSNKAGEIAVKTPFMMKEYLGQPMV